MFELKAPGKLLFVAHACDSIITAGCCCVDGRAGVSKETGDSVYFEGTMVQEVYPHL